MSRNHQWSAGVSPASGLSPNSLQKDKSIEAVIDQLKIAAFDFVQLRLVENCVAASGAGSHCACKDYLADIYVDAIKSLRPPNLISCDVDKFSDSLGQVYEHLLLYTVKPEVGRACTLVPIEKSKKRLGNYYTPRNLACFVVEKALAELVYDEHGDLLSAETILKLKVVDPSMGCGMFLSSSLSYLAERLSESRSRLGETSDLESCRQDVALNCLYGVDLDPAAVRVARYLLALQCCSTEASRTKIEIALERKLKCGDSLVGILPSQMAGLHSIDDANAACDKVLGIGVGIGAGPLSPFQYFHWTLQFPDVFRGDAPGFDAVLGNPPWEILKPNSREFFQHEHAEFWQLGKQEALRKQKDLRSEERVEAQWHQYKNKYKLLGLWISKSGSYHLQGSSDSNAYKLFVELSLSIAKSGGVISLIVPSSLYCDKGTTQLRSALLNKHQWKYLRAFQNSAGVFDIHRSFKFCFFLVVKDGATMELNANFDLQGVEQAANVKPLKLAARQLKTFSPKWLSVPELTSDYDLQLVEKISASCIRFDEFTRQFGLKFRREFDMTNHSGKFILRDQAEQAGYKPDSHGRWILGDDIALPLYEGRMIGQFDCAQKGWVEGKGRQALWLPVPDGRILPQYLVPEKFVDTTGTAYGALKVGFLGVGSATNMRSMIAACLGHYPCGNSVPTFHCEDPRIALLLTACLNSFVFDYFLRLRLVGNNLNYFILQETFLPRSEPLLAEQAVIEIAARLSWNDRHWAPELRQFLPADSCGTMLRPQERLHLRCLLDALIADLYELEIEDMEHILRGCDGVRTGIPQQPLKERLDAKGFWRVDKTLPPELRQTVMTLRVFRELKVVGRKEYLARNYQNDWRVPVET